MKKTKLITTLCVLAVVLLLGVFALPTTAQAATEDDYTYSVSGGEATITKYSGSGGDITIPSKLGGYPVTAIDDFAFSYCTSLKSATIPDSVGIIGNCVFSDCTSLTDVTIGDGVESIGYSLFWNCTSLTGIWVNENNPVYVIAFIISLAASVVSYYLCKWLDRDDT